MQVLTGFDKTRNMEHSGTCRNIFSNPEMIPVSFSLFLYFSLSFCCCCYFMLLFIFTTILLLLLFYFIFFFFLKIVLFFHVPECSMFLILSTPCFNTSFVCHEIFVGSNFSFSCGFSSDPQK